MNLSLATSQIGAPIDEPKNASVQLFLKKGEDMEKVKKSVSEIVDSWLEKAPKITELIVEGKAGVYY